MNKLPYKILMISWDATLAKDNPQFGDAIKRHIKYGEQVAELHIITYNRRGHKLQEKKLAENVWVYPTNSFNPFYFLTDAKLIAKRLLQDKKFDLVISQDPFLTAKVAIWIKQKFNTKFLLHFHGDFWENKNWLKERWYNRFLVAGIKQAVKQADAIRVMSQGQKDKFIESGIAEDKVKVISTPVNIDNFNQKQLLPSELATDKKVILMVGRKDKVKDFETLFKAIDLVYQQNKEIELWLIGNYTSEDNLSLPQGLIVKALGQIPIANLPGYYQACYLTVLSSTSESFGKVLVEANACAKPVISTATTGAKEIIQDGYNGYLVPVKDSKVLAGKILLLLANPTKAEELGKNGQQLVKEKFADNTDKIINFWQEIIQR